MDKVRGTTMMLLTVLLLSTVSAGTTEPTSEDITAEVTMETTVELEALTSETSAPTTIEITTPAPTTTEAPPPTTALITTEAPPPTTPCSIIGLEVLNLMVISESPKSLYAEWDSLNCPGVIYIVTWENDKEGDFNESTTDNFYNITTDLVPGFAYNVSVYGELDDGSTSDTSYVEHNTMPATPTAVKSVAQPGRLQMSWVQEGRHEEVYMSFNPNDPGIAYLKDGPSKVNITGLYPGKEYLMRLWVESGLYNSSKDETYRRTPPNTPQLTVDLLNMTCVHLSAVVEDSVVDSFVFNVSCNETKPCGNIQPITKNSPDNRTAEVTVCELVPGTLYTASVVAVAGNESSSSDQQSIRTELSMVEDLTVSNPTTQGFNVTWTAVVGNFGSYTLHCKCLNGTQNCVDQSFLGLPGPSGTCSSLTSGASYYASVEVVRQGWTSTTSRDEPALTVPAAPTLDCIHASSTTLNVSVIGRSLYDLLRLRYEHPDDPVQQREMPSTSTVYLASLLYGARYEMNAVAESVFDKWNLTSQPATQQQCWTKPGQPNNVSTSDVDKRAFTLSWSIEAANYDETFHALIVREQESNDNCVQAICLHDGSQNCSITGISGCPPFDDRQVQFNMKHVSFRIDRLTPYKTYTVHIYTINAAGSSNPTMSSGTQTLEDVPGEAHLTQVSLPCAMNVSWTISEPNGIILSHELKWKMTRPADATFDNSTQLPGHRMEYRIESLVGDSLYDISLRSNTSVGWGNWSTISGDEIQACQPSGPTDITIVPGPCELYTDTPCQATVNWKPPEVIAGETNYTLTWMDATNPDAANESIILPGYTSNSTTLNNLLAGQKYKIRLIAVTTAGSSDFGTGHEDFTTLDAAPYPVKDKC